MSKANAVVCPSCGFANNPANAARCTSCGASIETLGKVERSAEELRAMQFQQEGINGTWVGISTVVQAVLTAAIIFGLPLAMPRVIDFEGGSGMVACIPLWFVGGALLGLISPGRTFLEPAVGAFLVAVPTTYMLIQSQTVRTLPTFLYFVLAGIGVMFTVVGAYVGEVVQLKPSDSPKPSKA